MSFAYLALYTGDYLRDTRHLTPEESGCYLHFLMHCWDQKGPVPLDERKQAGICNAKSGGEIESMRRVLLEYFVKMDDGWYNERMQNEIIKSEILSKSRSKFGKLGAAIKSRSQVRRAKSAQAKHEPSTSQAEAKHELVSPSPSPSPSPEVLKDLSTTIVVDVLSPAKDVSKLPDCPHKKIIDLYHERLPLCPRVREWNNTRQRMLSSRWKQKAVERHWKSADDGLKMFENLFDFIGESKFLTGQATAQPGKPPFVADLEWIVRPQNWAKIIEGKYHHDSPV